MSLKVTKREAEATIIIQTKGKSFIHLKSISGISYEEILQRIVTFCISQLREGKNLFELRKINADVTVSVDMLSRSELEEESYLAFDDDNRKVEGCEPWQLQPECLSSV